MKKTTYIEFYNNYATDIEQTAENDQLINELIEKVENSTQTQADILTLINKHLTASRYGRYTVSDFWEVWRDNDFSPLLYAEYDENFFDDDMLIIAIEKYNEIYIFNMKCNG